MRHIHCPDEHWLRGLPAPTKANYFYGMLLTEELLKREQRHGEGKHWLLNRLSLGKGVLTGLDFELVAGKKLASPPTVNRGWVRLHFGVALDGYGREIVVPGGPKDGTCDDPGDHELCAVRGRHETRVSDDPDGLAFLAALTKLGVEDPAAIKQALGDSATLELQVAYDQRKSDPVRALAGHCSDDCEPSTIREHFRIRVRLLDKKKAAQNYPAAIDEEAVRRWEKDEKLNDTWTGNLSEIFPQEPNETIRHRKEAQEAKHELVPPAFPAKSSPEELEAEYEELAWVTLGVLKLELEWEAPEAPKPPAAPGDGAAKPDATPPKLKKLTFSKVGRYYRQLFSNDSLSRLLFALADRVDEAARVRTLTHAGGEGQTAPVYRKLPEPLQVRVIDGALGQPKNVESLKVRFEILTSHGGKLHTQPFTDTVPYESDHPGATSSVEVAVKIADPTDKSSSALSEKVYWRFEEMPGLHTVSARIVPAVDDTKQDPAFHPGSQIIFHATATPTAPTIIGMYLHDWHTPVKDGCVDWKAEDVKLRVVFSRRMAESVVKNPADWLKVWRVFSKSCDPERAEAVNQPESQTLEPGTGKTFQLLSFGNTGDDYGPWYIDFRLPKLLGGLCDYYALRMLVAIRPNADVESTALTGSPPYPNAQRLDATFAGSFLTAEDRHELWWKDALMELPGGKGAPPLKDLWTRFEPRERSLPSGDGTEGASFPDEFHKSFELQLPRCR